MPERGATLVEYSLIIALVVVVSLGALTTMTDRGEARLAARAGAAGTPSESIGALPAGGGGGGTTGGTTGGGGGTTVTATIGPSNMSGQASDAGQKWIAQITIRVTSSAGPVSGATITGSWDAGGNNGDSECTTDAAGECTVQRTNINDNNSSTSFTVEELTSGDPNITIDYTPPTPPDSYTVACSSPVC